MTKFSHPLIFQKKVWLLAKRTVPLWQVIGDGYMSPVMVEYNYIFTLKRKQ